MPKYEIKDNLSSQLGKTPVEFKRRIIRETNQKVRVKTKNAVLHRYITYIF